MKGFEFKYKNCLIDKEKIRELSSGLKEYNNKIKSIVDDGGYNEYESFLNLPDDSQAMEDIANEVKNYKNLKYIIVVGIGGSNQSAKAVYNSLGGQKTKILFLEDLTDGQIENTLGKVLRNIHTLSEILVIVATKSGQTIETIALTETLVASLKETFDEVVDRVLVVTGSDSRFLENNKNQEIGFHTVPSKIVGRFSAFSKFALLPLALSGLDVGKLVQGAKDMRDFCLGLDVEDNPASISAAVLGASLEGGKDMHVTFLWNKRLAGFGSWYAQLLAESLSKGKTYSTKSRGQGITPITSIGTRDLHSMTGLFLSGPKDKVTTFVYSSKRDSKFEVPSEDRVFENVLPELSGRKTGDIMSSIRESVISVYKKRGLPFMEIGVDGFSEYTMGALLQFKMLEVIYLAKIIDVDAFSQPDVEDYKRMTRESLK